MDFHKIKCFLFHRERVLLVVLTWKLSQLNPNPPKLQRLLKLQLQLQL